MPFKLPNTPSARSLPHELADYAEIYAWLYQSCSSRQVQRVLNQLDDNLNNLDNDRNLGIEDTDDVTEELASNMLDEFRDRSSSSQLGYPFQLSSSGSTLYFDQSASEDETIVYLFLLLATRLDMNTEKLKAGLDGTKLHERLSASTLKNYLGRTQSKVTVFGTASTGGFQDRVNSLCRTFGEGKEFRYRDSGRVNAQDDSLDIVGWIPFSDRRPGKLAVFGQCKTGTNWLKTTSELAPDVFIDKWMRESFALLPIRAFFVAESQDRGQWFGVARQAGLFFDRCRIVNFAREMEEDLLHQLKLWTNSAKEELLEREWARSF